MAKNPFCILIFGILVGVNVNSKFAGSAVVSDSQGTRSVFMTGGNGAVGAISSRLGGDVGSGVAVGSGSAGTFASTGTRGTGGAYASASAGEFPKGYLPYPLLPQSPPFLPPYPQDPYYYGVNGVYSSSDTNGIHTRFEKVGPGGQTTIVEQNGDAPPKVHNYNKSNKESGGKSFWETFLSFFG